MTSEKLPTGIVFDKSKGRYRARICRGGRTIHLGWFETVAEATAAYEGAEAREGPPMGGVLSEEQKARQRERYAAWQKSVKAFSDAAEEALGPVEDYERWVAGASFEFGITRFRFERIDYEKDVFGDDVDVLVFSRKCLEEGCSERAYTYWWLSRASRRGSVDFCESHDKGYATRFRDSRRFNLTVWDAVHASLGRDREEDGSLPYALRDEARRRAGVLRRKLKNLLNGRNVLLQDLLHDWWYEFEEDMVGEAMDLL